MIGNYAQKQILILGAGVTGLSVARALTSRSARVVLVDDHSKLAVKPEDIELSQFDYIVISPGWRQDHWLVIKVLESKIPVLNEIDLAWQFRSEVAPNQKWLAITGTNGKTTTVEMTTKILQSAGLNAIACGNVGYTVIDALDNADQYDYLVIELSSFQLQWMRQAQFIACAILNLAEDHLDWHGNFESYAEAKFSILEHSQIAILNGNDNEVVNRTKDFSGRKVYFSLHSPISGEIGIVENLLVDRAFVVDAQEAEMICEIQDIKPNAAHNILNALAAASLARSMGLDCKVIQAGLRQFKPGRHRIEIVLEKNLISWVDDSKATNTHAALASILSYNSVIWIAGGLAKGADISGLIRKCINHVKAVILIGTDRELFRNALLEFAPGVHVVEIEEPNEYQKGSDSNLFMELIVASAKVLSSPGDTVLMAPACASMDQFISYADRGERFATAVMKVIENE